MANSTKKYLCSFHLDLMVLTHPLSSLDSTRQSMASNKQDEPGTKLSAALSRALGSNEQNTTMEFSFHAQPLDLSFSLSMSTTVPSLETLKIYSTNTNSKSTLATL